MIEPDSDEFYEELRRKLADYGSQPSEEVWANIRRRVPAAPAPALRPRSRVRRVVAAVGLLFLMLSGVLVARYYQSGWGKGATAEGSLVASSTRSANSSPARLAGSAAALARANTSSSTSSALKGSTLAKVGASTAAVVPSHGGLRTDLQQKASLSATPSRPTAPRQQHISPSITRAAALADNSRSQSFNQKAIKLVSSTESAVAMAGQRKTSGRVTNLASAASSSINSQPTEGIQNNTLVAPEGEAAAPDFSLLSPVSIALTIPAPGTPLVAPIPSPSAPPPAPAPTVAARRLAIQLLAGPALSYRHLGRIGTDSVTSEVEKLERPAESYSAELGLTYALTPRLTVLTGLSYTEYATRLDLTVKQPVVVYASFRRPVLQYTNGVFNTLYVPDSIPSSSNDAEQRVRHRDVYRFVSVPLQIQYQLGTAGRFSYGLLLGTTANLYVGGRTSKASGCGCEQDTWHLGGSPFRLVSLGLTAGSSSSYRLAERWHLSLQPTFNYLLTPLNQAQNRSTRHLLSAGMRTGVSFDLK